MLHAAKLEDWNYCDLCLLLNVSRIFRIEERDSNIFNLMFEFGGRLIATLLAQVIKIEIKKPVYLPTTFTTRASKVSCLNNIVRVFSQRLKSQNPYVQLIAIIFRASFNHINKILECFIRFSKVFNKVPTGSAKKVCRVSNFESWINFCAFTWKIQVFCFDEFVCAKEMLTKRVLFNHKIDCQLNSWVIFVWFLQRDEFAR